MKPDIFEIINQLNTELNTLQEVKEIVNEWASEAHEKDAYTTLLKLCNVFNITMAWRYDE